jgi:hypothetical protein
VSQILLGTALATSLCCLMIGCGDGDDARVVEVIGGQVEAESPTDLSLSLGACRSSVEDTSVTESRDEVRVEVTVTGGDNQLRCSDLVTVSLEQPLGDRKVVDESNGATVSILQEGETP